MNNDQDWLEIKLETTHQFDSDSIEETLFAAGSLSVTLTSKADEIILAEPTLGEMPLWENGIIITGLFDKGFDPNDAFPILKDCLKTQYLPLIALENLAERVWESEWTKFFHPIAFGQYLWICPSNKKVPKNKITSETQIITLDPGLAFGTGTHPTTAMALEHIATNNNVGLQIIDFGCGSGILGIAALKMGARHVAMIDIDQQALSTTQENTNINHVSDKISCYLPSDMLVIKADFLISNILLEPLLQLKDTFVKICNKGTKILLTGLLNGQVEKIIEVYQHDFYNFSISNRGDWSVIVARKS